MENVDPRVYSAMQTGSPYATYRKTVLGKIYITVISPFTSVPEGLLLSGDPKSPKATYDVWSEKEDVFFKRMNKIHFDRGNIIKVSRDPVPEQKKAIEQYSDVELKEVLSLRYVSLQKVLSEIESIAVLYRMEGLAVEMDKSEKIINSIRTRIAYLQGENPQTVS